MGLLLTVDGRLADLLFDATCSQHLPLDILWSVAMMSLSTLPAPTLGSWSERMQMRKPLYLIAAGVGRPIADAATAALVDQQQLLAERLGVDGGAVEVLAGEVGEGLAFLENVDPHAGLEPFLRVHLSSNRAALNAHDLSAHRLKELKRFVRKFYHGVVSAKGK